MISCVSWVPKGVANPNPKRFQISDAEQKVIDQFSKEEETNVETETNNKEEKIVTLVEEEVEEKEKQNINNNNDLPADLRMDEYSSDEDEGAGLGNLLMSGNDDMLMRDNNDEDSDDDDDDDQMEDKNDNDDDDSSDDDDDNSDDDDVPDTREYMPLDIEGLKAMRLGGDGGGEVYYDDEDDEDEEEMEDTRIKDTDAIVLVSKTEDDHSTLEVHLYETLTGHMYVHHDIYLPSFPLCVAHTSNYNNSKGNYCAVGMFSPGIELWNLDILDPLEPVCILGGVASSQQQESLSSSSKKKKKGTLSQPQQEPMLVKGSHTDAIMGLSWNPIHSNILASASADKTVKLWDLSSTSSSSDGTCPTMTLDQLHSDKIQSVEWHPMDGNVLATGSYDKTVGLVDVRSPSSQRKARISADCESLQWDPCQSYCLTVACEDGMVTCWDIRNGFGTSSKKNKNGELWSFVAHEYGGVSDIAYNRHVPGLLATCSIDKMVALWDTHELSSSSEKPQPTPCAIKDMKVGKLYSVSFYPSSPWLLGCGGSNGDLALWDMSNEEETLKQRFGSRVTIKNDDNNNKRQESDATTIDFQTILKNDESAQKARDKMEQHHSKQKGSSSKKKKKAHRR